MFPAIAAVLVYLLNIVLVGAPIVFFCYLQQHAITRNAVFTGPILVHATEMTLVGVFVFLINMLLLLIAWRKKFKQAKLMALSFGLACVAYIGLYVFVSRYTNAHMIHVIIQ
jgi:hypothetical protein